MKTLPLFLICASLLMSAGSVKHLQWKRDRSGRAGGEHFELALQAADRGKWQEVSKELRILIDNFPDCDERGEALFLLGVAEFHRGEYDIANENFSQYLQEEATPAHFEEVFQYKFEIAEAFRDGHKRRAGGYRAMPRWSKADEQALDIYNEISTTLPSHELAVKSLYGRAQLLTRQKDYQEAVEKYQTLISRFSKHPYAPESYLSIAEVYLKKAKEQPQDPDLIALAQINLRRFRQDFPADGRLLVAEEHLEQMRELIARALIETGFFYEKTKKKQSAFVYYAQAIKDYPDTRAAELARRRLNTLQDVAHALPGGDQVHF